MRAFEVFINHKRLCVAGIEDDGVLTAIVTFATKKGVRDDLELHVGGLISPIRENVTWSNKPLNVGDEIRVKIVDTDITDSPRTRERENPAEDLKRQKDYVRAMARKLGWQIQSKPKRSRGK